MRDDASELLAWQAPNASQRALQRAFVEHARTHEQPSSRACLPDHLTTSALVVSSDHAKVLLGLHRKVGRWLQFGGHVELHDASLAAAAMREAREESGIERLMLHSSHPVQLDRHAAPCAPKARHHLDVQYLATAPAGAVPTVSEESLDVRWFAVDQLPPDADDAVRRLVSTSLRRLTSGGE